MKNLTINYEHIKIGDRVKLITNHAYSSNKIGDIGKVIEFYSHSQFCAVDCGRGYKYSIDSYWGDLKKLILVLPNNIHIL